VGSHYVLAGIAVPVVDWKRFEAKVEKLKLKFDLGGKEIHTAWLLRAYNEQSKIPDFERLSYPARSYEVQLLRNSILTRLAADKTKRKEYAQTKKNFVKTADYVHLTRNERMALVLELAKLIGAWASIRLFAECVDKTQLNSKVLTGTVDEHAFEQVVARFEQYLKIYSASSRRTQFGLLVHDNNETVKHRHTALMKKFHSHGTRFTDISNIIETPMFVDSQLTSMIQIADLCSYALRRYLENGENSLFDEVFKRADQKNGKAVGVRHFSKSTCICKICAAHR
jgi:hypothetical protein